MKKFIKNNYILILIVVMAAILRLVLLGSIPISLNIDETALGYNSYSILLTGRDEYGQIPIMLKSFGDWKVPGYALITTIPIMLFDLNEFSVRLPSAIAGILQIILIYYITLKIFKRKSIAFLASFFLALTPWAIYFSRIAYEVNVATTFFMIGFLGLLKYLDNIKKNGKYILISSIFFSLTIITYHAYIIFTPLFIFTVAIYLRKFFYLNKFIFLSILILSVTSFSYFYITSQTMSKFSDVSIFSDANILEERVNVFRTDNSNENPIIQKALHNKYAGLTYHIGQNYANSFSPSFLFDKGGEKFLHNIGTMGNLYLIYALFLVFGLIYFHKYKNNKLMLVLTWLILAPIPSMFTKDTPSSTRLFIMLVPLIIFISIGAYQIYDYLINRKLIGKALIIGITVLFFVNAIYFLDAYFVHMNFQRARYLHYGFKEMVEIANKNPEKKIEVYDPDNFPYISFLFYNKYDPKKFRESVVYYPKEHSNFVNVKSFDRYSFVDDIDYENIREDTIYFDYRGIRDEDYKIIYPSGEPAFKYFTKE